MKSIIGCNRNWVYACWNNDGLVFQGKRVKL